MESDIQDVASLATFSSDPSKLLSKLVLYHGNLVTLRCDAIVNAANNKLRGGEGVDGAIHRAAGPELSLYCEQLEGCETGKAKCSPGFALPAKFIFHTVGPVGEIPHLLSGCYWSCLELAKEYGCNSIAFPCISTGAYGYPPADAAAVAVQSTMRWLAENFNAIDKIVFCCYLEEDFKIYGKLLEEWNKSEFRSRVDNKDQ